MRYFEITESQERYLYHATREEHLADIKRDGLTPNIDRDPTFDGYPVDGRLFLSKTEDGADCYAENISTNFDTDMVVLRTPARGVRLGKDPYGNLPDGFTRQSISPDRLEIKRNGIWSPLIGKINEAPISSMSFDGPDGDFSAGTSFGAVDRALLQSEKARTKIIKAFEKTPFDFEIFFINNGATDGDARLDNQSAGTEYYKPGIKTNYNQNDVDARFKSENDWRNKKVRSVANPVVKAEAGKIRVVLPTNLSELSNKMPMTAWTVAHKLGHAFQDHFSTGIVSSDVPSSPKWNSRIGIIVERIGLLLEQLFWIETKGLKNNFDPDNQSTTDNARQFNYELGLIKKLTMKSARERGNPDKNKLEDSFEIFPELVAQWLISGQVTMTVKKAKSIALVHEINGLIRLLFKQVVGKVLVAT